MYRLLHAGLPMDPSYTEDLNEMGYFFDPEGAVRKIRPPHGTFQYYISNNERINDTHREAFHRCIMREVESRMAALGFTKLWLPQLTETKPKNQPSVPIMLPEKEELKQRKRILAVVNDDYQDLASMAFRLLTKEAGIEAGSMVALAKEMFAGNSEQKEAAPDKISQPGFKHRMKIEEKMREEEEERQKEAKAAQPDAAKDGGAPFSTNSSPKKSHKATENAPLDGKLVDTSNAKFDVPSGFKTPGLVTLNTGQLFYSHNEDRAMNNLSWNAKPRMSGASPRAPIDSHFNRIEGNKTIEEHVKFVFDNIISSDDWISDDAELYLIGAGNGGDTLLRFLDNEWAEYKHRVVALALADPTPIQPALPLKNPEFVDFLSRRCRSMEVSLEPYLTPLAVPSPSKQKESKSAQESSSESQSSRDAKQSIWIQNIMPTNTVGSITALDPSNVKKEGSMLANSGQSDNLSNISLSETIKPETYKPDKTEPTKSDDWGVHYFPRFSSGVPTFGECVLASTYKYMLSWFEEVAAHPNSYRNPEFELPVQPVAGAEVEDTEVFDTAIEPKESFEEDGDDEVLNAAMEAKEKVDKVESPVQNANGVLDTVTKPEKVDEVLSPAQETHNVVPEVVITPSHEDEDDDGPPGLVGDVAGIGSTITAENAAVTANDEDNPPTISTTPIEGQEQEPIKEAGSGEDGLKDQPTVLGGHI